MLVWTIRQYVNRRGERELSTWFDALPVSIQVSVVVTIEQLTLVERDYWRRPTFDTLHELEGMGEIILGTVDRVQTRLIGFFGPGRHVFTVVSVVTKKDRVYSPKNWEATAEKRRRECETEKDRSDVWHP